MMMTSCIHFLAETQHQAVQRFAIAAASIGICTGGRSTCCHTNAHLTATQAEAEIFQYDTLTEQLLDLKEGEAGHWNRPTRAAGPPHSQ
jgi:hypothetical protein